MSNTEGGHWLQPPCSREPPLALSRLPLVLPAPLRADRHRSPAGTTRCSREHGVAQGSEEHLPEAAQSTPRLPMPAGPIAIPKAWFH